MIQDPTLGPQVLQQTISFSGSGDNTVIGGVFGKFFKVLQMFFVVDNATVLTFKSGTNAISGGMSFVSNMAMFMDYIQLPLEGVNSGEAFIINSSNAVNVGGTIWFIQAL